MEEKKKPFILQSGCRELFHNGEIILKPRSGTIVQRTFLKGFAR